jgi:hypothetical protein
MKVLKTIRRLNEKLDNSDVLLRFFEKGIPYIHLKALPKYFVLIHTALILLSMIALYNRFFLSSGPYSCFYIPFCLVSGPVVYIIAHYLQHYSAMCFPYNSGIICWNLVPGCVCLILGGLQWWLIGKLLHWSYNKLKLSPTPNTTFTF